MATTSAERIGALDTLRGVAVLGILLLNIVGFGMPNTAYLNPRAFGGWQGADLLVYLFNFVAFDGKMRGLFSFLFGASMLLVIERAERRGESAGAVHFRRMAALLAFGLLHLWLIWWGDILAHYALIGCIAFLFRRMGLRGLIGWGVALLVVELLLIGMILPFIDLGMAQAASSDPKLAEQGRQMLSSFREGFGIPPASYLAGELAQHRAGYLAILSDRFRESWFIPLSSLFQTGPETLAYMLFGMAGYRTGLLTGAWPRARYLRAMLIGFAVGIPAYALLAHGIVGSGFDMKTVVRNAMVLTVPVRPVMIVAWACLILLLARPGGWLTERLAAAGRMAFTNYLMTSILCTTFFYGYGFGQFGRLGRAELYLVVLAVWALVLLWSRPWLERFRYGPFEWVWRSLSRGAVQPMRGAAPA